MERIPEPGSVEAARFDLAESSRRRTTVAESEARASGNCMIRPLFPPLPGEKALAMKARTR
jgi:hypothetical protein